ncbi:hypothetical protein N656DRAFT_323938 [Canariomyces notabilis]|uniref:Uncharacterized protein n=1 Tax=Canariomyces notabilis TaxID=2074819 RepID=A0AAN6QIQ0_9PEZI|nr:hypothetical protein N656DRAFT_323938 [Canariomyces arenarius]
MLTVLGRRAAPCTKGPHVPWLAFTHVKTRNTTVSLSTRGGGVITRRWKEMEGDACKRRETSWKNTTLPDAWKVPCSTPYYCVYCWCNVNNCQQIRAMKPSAPCSRLKSDARRNQTFCVPDTWMQSCRPYSDTKHLPNVARIQALACRWAWRF